MNMNTGEIIKKLRKKKDMTQEQLAEYLNISPQAISRWEINSTLPDITLIPALANIFNVSADVLLGIDITAKEKRIQEIINHSWEYFTKGNHVKEMEILLAGLKEFPNDYKIMNQLLHTPLESSEIIRIAEKILAECVQDSFRHNAIRALCGAYSKTGEFEKAKELSHRTPFITECYEFIMEDMGSEQEKAHQMRDNIFMLVDFIWFKLDGLNSPPEDYGNPYTPQEKIAIRKKIITIIECLIEDGDYGRFCERAAWAYLNIGEFYTEIGDYANALENLRHAAEYVIMIDRECDPAGDNYNPDRTYTSLLLRGMKYSHINCTMGMAGTYSMEMLNNLTDKSFDPLRGNTDFIELEEKLKIYAKTK